VEVLFVSAQMRDVLCDLGALRRRWGSEHGTRIALRLQQLSCSPTLAGMQSLPGRCRALDGQWAGCLGMDVSGSYLLLFRPTGPAPRGSSEAINWAADGVTILGVVKHPE
jgi:hypothetical protein